jgi:hypothetical protein
MYLFACQANRTVLLSLYLLQLIGNWFLFCDKQFDEIEITMKKIEYNLDITPSKDYTAIKKWIQDFVAEDEKQAVWTLFAIFYELYWYLSSIIFYILKIYEILIMRSHWNRYCPDAVRRRREWHEKRRTIRASREDSHSRASVQCAAQQTVMSVAGTCAGQPATANGRA